MSKITFVTCLFNIERDKTEIEGMSRDISTYLKYFDFWAGLKNELIIYTSKEYKNDLMEIRKKHNLEEKTKIVLIDNIYEIAPNVYDNMCEIERDSCFKNFRYYENAMSNTAKYNYLIYIMYWAMNDAVERGLIKDKVAWIDLGFNHGGKFYTNRNEFDFEWNYSFCNKITCFALFDPNTISAIDSLQFQKDCFMGGITVVDKNKMYFFWDCIKKAVDSLLMLECMDDDQQWLLMVYKKYPHEFEIKICNWFEQFIVCGHQELAHREINMKHESTVILLIKKVINIFRKTQIKDFIYRTKERAKLMQ